MYPYRPVPGTFSIVYDVSLGWPGEEKETEAGARGSILTDSFRTPPATVKCTSALKLDQSGACWVLLLETGHWSRAIHSPDAAFQFQRRPITVTVAPSPSPSYPFHSNASHVSPGVGVGVVRRIGS